MRKKVILGISSILIILCVSIININDKSSVQSVNIQTKSLIESYRLALKEAKQWNEDATLYYMTSIDEEYFDSQHNGDDGKRRNWNFEFAIHETNKHLIITIHDGQIVNKKEIKGPKISDELISENDISIDSTNAVAQAKEMYKLKPGEDWAKGYHYVLRKYNGKSILAVFGIDKEEYFTRVYFDIKSGNLLTAEHKIPNGGGLFSNGLEIKIPNKKPYAVTGISTSPEYSIDKTMVVWGYKNYLSPYSDSMLMVSKDSGNEWVNAAPSLDKNSIIMKVLFSPDFHKNHTIFAVYNNKIFLSSSFGKEWKEILSTKERIIDCKLYKSTLVVLTEKSLLQSSNSGKDWSLIDNKISGKCIDIGINGVLYLVSNENTLFRRSNSSWEEIDLQLMQGTLDVQVIKDVLITCNQKSILVFDINKNKSEIIELQDGISKVFKGYENEREYQFYIYSNSGNLICYKKEGEKNLEKVKDIKRPQDGHVADLHFGPAGEMFLSIIPETIWKEFGKEN